MILGNHQQNSVTVKVNSYEKKSESNKILLLGITIDNKLTFNEHISNFCRTANFFSPKTFMYLPPAKST